MSILEKVVCIKGFNIVSLENKTKGSMNLPQQQKTMTL